MTTVIEAIDAVKSVALQDAERKAAHAIEQAKTQLVLSRSSSAIFFASLAIEKLKYASEWRIGTAGTDGRHLLYNPDFINSLSADELIGVICHEVMHCAAKHMMRVGAREPNKANVAMDCSINNIIRDAGFSLPKDGCFPGEGSLKNLPLGLSFEEYYAVLPDMDYGEDDGGCGVAMPLSQSEHETLAQQWDASVATAQRVASQRETLPGSLERFCGEILAAVVDWRKALADFITRPAKRDYDWRRPNRRHVHSGLFLPRIGGMEIGHVCVAIDTSGSIDQKTLQRFMSEVNDICSQGVTKLSVGWHHVSIYRVDEFNPAEEPFVIGNVCSGGTSHKWLQSFIDGLSEPPVVVVLLTDMESDFPDTAPDVPVLWASISKTAKAPFGEIIFVPVE